jgi:sugar phosphate isomerase/epimerase
LTEAIEATLSYGFEGIDVQIELVNPLAQGMGLKYCQQIIQVDGLKPGSWVLPTRWRTDDETLFQKDLAELAELSQLAHDVGYTGVTTAVSPASETRAMPENLEWCKARLQQIADVVGQHGHRLGLEYLATETLRKNVQHDFVHDLAGLKQLVEAIGRDNVGYVLDSWHWHLAGETADDIRSLKPEQIVTVHVSDAPEDVPNDEQIDNVRRLPGSTGVIDIGSFMQAVNDIGYEGPLVAEPFAAGLRSVHKNRVVRAVSDSLDRIWFRKDEIAAEEAVRAEAAAVAAAAAATAQRLADEAAQAEGEAAEPVAEAAE